MSDLNASPLGSAEAREMPNGNDPGEMRALGVMWHDADVELPPLMRWVWIYDEDGSINLDKRDGPGRYDWIAGSWVTHWAELQESPPSPPEGRDNAARMVETFEALLATEAAAETETQEAGGGE